MSSKMAETVTENLFRVHYGPMAFIEKAAIPASCKFISKEGTGKPGFPDFFRDQEDGFAVVVEAKADDIAAAEADIRHYLTYNALTKDLLGVAIAGQSLDKLKVSYFYRRAGGTDVVALADVKDVLLDVHALGRLHLKARYGDKMSTEHLVTVLKGLNSRFHKDGKVRSTDRSLFFSGLMIALNNANFRNTYQGMQAPSDEERSTTRARVLEAHHLNAAIVSAIDSQLSSKINNLSKEFSWRDTFAFIKNVDYPLADYKAIIQIIETDIFGPFKNDEKQDILGRAYKIFLSRAGKAETKNIILTPDHIKELMVKLARLTVDDVVLDTCTGSGGFLMESMETLLKLAHGDANKIRHIKENQLVGFELDSVLFSLACSNMFLHGDGKTNLLFRSSLLSYGADGALVKEDAILLDYVRKLNPTRVIINPPYESNSSIKFVKQAIEFLNPNGRLLVLMPTPTLMLNQGGLTDELLKAAKLDFVIKMPDNLFSEQQRGVHTSIFGFTKTPHCHSDAVLFYNLEDDGFVSVQHKGKLDKNNAWAAIEAQVLDCVQNLNEVPGVAVKKKIFTKEGKLQSTGVVSVTRSDAGFELVKVSDLFSVKKGTLASGNAVETGEFNFITAAEEWKRHNESTHDGEALVYAVGASGSLGRCHYVNGKFVASNLCLVLTPKEKAPPIDLQFYAHYFSLIRPRIVEALAAGTSKKTIGQPAFEDYLIEYVPLEAQKEFLATNVARADELKAQLAKLEAELSRELSVQSALFHRYAYA